MFNLYIENIRCFAGRYSIPIRPLTLLVGENSAGKTTFLSTLSIATDSIGFPLRPGFNDPPYDLGTFREIATRKGRSVSPSFSIGRISTDKADSRIATYRNTNGQPSLSTYLIAGYGGARKMLIDFQRSKITYNPSIGRHKRRPRLIHLRKDLWNFVAGDPRWALRESKSILDTFFTESIESSEIQSDAFDLLHNTEVSPFDTLPARTSVSLAPMRTVPRRVYDAPSATFRPEGDHTPVVLTQVLKDVSGKPNSRSIRSTLESFGRESGLFHTLSVRQLGGVQGGPLQIFIKQTSGEEYNLSDVGYGVSQVLPIVLQSALSSASHLVLMQQPEVHLHPKAQAALGSLFANLVGKHESNFVIETHSDYLIDRVRQEVARGRISSSDVSILYFRKSLNRASVHEIRLDDFGNLVNTPKGYRSFFLRESLRMLNRARSKAT